MASLRVGAINQFLFLFVSGLSHGALGVLNCNFLFVSSLDCLEGS